jgi:RNA recognition motif-containing protein
VECGEVEDVHLLENKEGMPKGMGFVEFKTREGVVKALALHGKVKKSWCCACRSRSWLSCP